MKLKLLIPLVGFAALGAGFALTAGMTHAKERLKVDGATQAALDTLHEELQRRFHDRTDVDFGFSRVIRPAHRMHMLAPTMNQSLFISDPKLPRRPEYRIEKDAAGKPITMVNDAEVGWIETTKLKPVMVPETDREKQAIKTLRDGKVDVAIYTFGLLGIDEVPVRAKGPGYLSQKAASAPPAIQMILAAEQAWRTGSEEVVLQGPEGWQLTAHRVKADGEDCVKCHTAHSVIQPGGQPIAKYAIGESVGLVVLAVRPRR